jgi:hypothetical protein
MFDYFVAELRCPRCGATSSTDENTSMQTHIRGGSADGSELTVGYSFSPVYLETEHIIGAGYALIAPPAPGEPIRLLDVWACPACDTEQWAMIEIAGGRIARIEAVPMNPETLKAANFISDVNAELLAAALLDISPAELTKRKLDPVDVLRQRLAQT